MDAVTIQEVRGDYAQAEGNSWWFHWQQTTHRICQFFQSLKTNVIQALMWRMWDLTKATPSLSCVVPHKRRFNWLSSHGIPHDLNEVIVASRRGGHAEHNKICSDVFIQFLQVMIDPSIPKRGMENIEMWSLAIKIIKLDRIIDRCCI